MSKLIQTFVMNKRRGGETGKRSGEGTSNPELESIVTCNRIGGSNPPLFSNN